MQYHITLSILAHGPRLEDHLGLIGNYAGLIGTVKNYTVHGQHPMKKLTFELETMSPREEVERAFDCLGFTLNLVESGTRPESSIVFN